MLPSQQEMDAFRAGLRHLRQAVLRADAHSLERARHSLAAAKFALFQIDGGLYYLRELPPRYGWGLYVIDPTSTSALVIEVPAPLEEWATLETGAHLFGTFGAAGLAVSTKPRSSATAEGDVLSNSRTLFHTFHLVFGRQDVVQVRGYGQSALRTLYGTVGDAGARIPSSLWVRSRLPDNFSLSVLKDLVGSIDLHWRPTPTRNLLRQTNRGGFAELFLRREDRKRLLARFLLGENPEDLDAGTPLAVDSRLDATSGPSLEAWVQQRKAELAPRGSNRYVVPKQETLLFLDEEVVGPIVRLVLASRLQRPEPQDVASELRAAHAAALMLDYGVSTQRSEATGDDFIVLSELSSDEKKRYWGSYVFRLGGHAPLAVEIPRPEYERTTLEYGASLFEKLRAAALLLAGSHPKANTDNSADVVQPQNKLSLFNLVNQVILRESKEQSFSVVQVRAFGHKPGVVVPEADALLAYADGRSSHAGLSELGRKLISTVQQGGLSVRFVDGSFETTGYEAHGSAQAAYLNQTGGKEFAVLWLSPYSRLGYRADPDRGPSEAQLAALGFATQRLALHEWLPDRSFVRLPDSVLGALRQHLARYQTTTDPNLLRGLLQRWPQYRFERIVDVDSQKSFLVVSLDGRLLPIVVRLAVRRGAFEAGDSRESMAVTSPLNRDDVRRFVESTLPQLQVVFDDD